MARMVQCVKLGREAEGLDKQPLKGDVGKKIFENVSKDAWKAWLEHSKMLINEFRLDLMSESGQRIWMTEMDKYFFGEGSKLPEQFINPGDKPEGAPAAAAPAAHSHDHAHGHSHDHGHDHAHGHSHDHGPKKEG